MRYTFNHLQEFTPIEPTPICGDEREIDKYIAPDARSLFDEENEDDNVFKINHYFATLHLEGKKKEILECQLVESILKKPLPNPQQQVDNLIRLLSGFDRAISFRGKELKYYTGSQHLDMFQALMEHLRSHKWISGHLGDSKSFQIQASTHHDIMLTIQGWERLAQMQKGVLSRNKGFMAMQFDNKVLQNVLENHFKPAMKRIGFELTKLDDTPKPGLIDTRMLVEIQTSDFIVADLSDENRGVYFEAGYAMGLGKTVIYTCEETKWKEKEAHFDVNHYQVILWNKRSKKSAENAAKQLALAVRAGFPDKAKIPDDE